MPRTPIRNIRQVRDESYRNMLMIHQALYKSKTMTKEEILEKAIERAEKNGFVNKRMYCTNFDAYEGSTDQCEYMLIFNHAFAKAFFGGKGYKFKLQQMVIQEDPLLYLAKFL